MSQTRGCSSFSNFNYLFKYLIVVLFQREWAEAKKELQEERDHVRTLTFDREQTLKNTMEKVEELVKKLADASNACSAAEARATVAEVCHPFVA